MAEIKLQELHAENFLAIYDVLLDIKQERQLHNGQIAVPLMRQIVRFTQLMPADSIGLRDRYCELRWKAAKLLEREGIIRNVNMLEASHRWQNYVELEPNPDAFASFFKSVEAEYASRRGAKPADAAKPASPTVSGRTRVFVIQGRDSRLRKGMFTFLRSLSLDPIEWIEAVALTGKSAPYIGEILDTAFANAQAIVVILSGDDEARLRTELRSTEEPAYEAELTRQARPNVIFEAGMAMAHNPERTALVEFGHLRPFSDVAGRHMVKMDGSTEKRQELAMRLQKAGCDVKMVGTDWHQAGDLTP